MTTDFSILTAFTVPEDYSWDKGIPFEENSTTKVAYTETNYVSGYAPGLDVYFINNSNVGEILFDQNFEISYDWNFGDFYDTATNNTSLSCLAPVRHIYTMPGRYTVTLVHTKIITQSVDTNPLLCRDRYNINWFWDNLAEITVFPPRPDRKTWNETTCLSSFPKTWDPELNCLQKHCRYWSWINTQPDGRTPTTWEQTHPVGGIYPKRWLYESNDTVCEIPEQPAVVIVDQSRQEIIKQFIVEVKELLPQAGMHSLTRPPAGQSPFTVQLTPRTTVCGSFPIERIDWDLGDGSPIKTVTRAGQPTDSTFVRNNVFDQDLADPRNFDLVHTYRRNANQYSVFYPSITAYSANTGSFDSCSTTIGPLDFESLNEDVNILKVKNTTDGILYVLDIDNTCSFVTTVTSTENNITPLVVEPVNKLKDTYFNIVTYKGNIGNNYPPPVINNCVGFEFVKPLYGLIVEEETLPLTSPLSALSAITQENDSYIIVR